MGNAFGSWRWALRVTPALGLIAVVLIFLTKEPDRGQHESSHHLRTSSYTEDLRGSFLLITVFSVYFYILTPQEVAFLSIQFHHMTEKIEQNKQVKRQSGGN